MSADILKRSFGREAFGLDPARYHKARPPYPEAVWTLLEQQAGLRAGIGILEVGAGTGLATEPLLAKRPARLLAVEPDARLAGFLGEHFADRNVEIAALPFEAVDLPVAGFDLVVSATAFHWLDAVPALERIRSALVPGGAVALIWNVFGDSDRADPFHDATAHLFAGHAVSPSGGGSTALAHGLDTEARLRDFRQAGFDPDPAWSMEWTLTLDPFRLRDLYSTYSNITALPAAEQERVLDGLVAIAEHQFAGSVFRNMTTAVYVARRL